jgi:hypothetical protein
MNGRSGSTVVLDGLIATKTVHGPWEAEYMRRFPDVFVRVTSICSNGTDDLVSYSMVEGIPATWDELDVALPRAAERLSKLWEHAGRTVPNWRPELFTHLVNICRAQELQLTQDQLRWLVREADHHGLKVDRCIHGDPTLANLIYDSRLPHSCWRWIDPLTRPYIPGDPLVDLGKLYQSCLGYERVLAGLEPQRDDALIEGLAEQLGLCEFHGLVWTAIHLIRLIPYQREGDKSVFAEMLHDLIDELQTQHTDD